MHAYGWPWVGIEVHGFGTPQLSRILRIYAEDIQIQPLRLNTACAHICNMNWCDVKRSDAIHYLMWSEVMWCTWDIGSLRCAELCCDLIVWCVYVRTYVGMWVCVHVRVCVCVCVCMYVCTYVCMNVSLYKVYVCRSVRPSDCLPVCLYAKTCLCGWDVDACMYGCMNVIHVWMYGCIDAGKKVWI